MPARVLLFTLLFAAPLVARADDLIELLQQRNCPDCLLADVDLVHADLRDADLQRAQLQRANLGQAHLDGADLRGADLSFTSLQGASLRGTKLHGTRLYGTDLRNADLTGAMLDPNALEEAHWSGAKGMQPQAQSHAALHNAGVGAAENDRWNEAENLFGLAIRKQPDAVESWVARAIAREKLGRRQLAIQDFTYASNLFAEAGATVQANQLRTAATNLQDDENNKQSGNGVGSALLGGLLSTSQALLPMAMKLFMPALGF
jgi:tetratricopeptide (TPR) repeat protein